MGTEGSRAAFEDDGEEGEDGRGVEEEGLGWEIWGWEWGMGDGGFLGGGDGREEVFDGCGSADGCDFVCRKGMYAI